MSERERQIIRDIRKLTNTVNELHTVYSEMDRVTIHPNDTEQKRMKLEAYKKNISNQLRSMDDEIKTKKEELNKLVETEKKKGGRKNGKRKSKTMKGRNKKGKKGSRMVLKSSRKPSRKR